MAVSRALRYQILRRDNHACRYCGAAAPDVKLTVDHVLAEALGGTDEPGNLVTACEACNGGKAATPPDAALVANVSNDVIRWAGAIAQAAEVRRRDLAVRDAYLGYFEALWAEYTYGPPHRREPVPLPSAWRSTVERFYELRLDEDEVARAVRVAMDADRVTAANTFRYFCGVCWRVIRELQDTAADIVMAELADEIDEEI